jgi:hypothetical protein
VLLLLLCTAALLPADRLFYHMICRELAERVHHGLDTSRHQQVLHATLAALADKVLQEKCWAAGPVGTTALQLRQVARQQQQQGTEGPESGQLDVSLLPLKRRHNDSAWQQQQQQQHAGCGSSDIGQWLQKQQQFVPHGLLLETVQDLQQKYLYHTDRQGAGASASPTVHASALDQAVGSLFGITVAPGNA